MPAKFNGPIVLPEHSTWLAGVTISGLSFIVKVLLVVVVPHSLVTDRAIVFIPFPVNAIGPGSMLLEDEGLPPVKVQA